MLANFPRLARACITRLAGGLLCAVCASSLWAQNLGQLKGRVMNADGAGLPFAIATATRVDTGEELPAATGPDGAYQLNLPPGTYRMTFESAGYRTVEYTAATVTAPRTLVEDCELEVSTGPQGSTAPPPEQKPAPSTSSSPQEPSLEDLGITATQAKGNPQTQTLLDKRSHMLKIHQRLGIITIEPFAATLITSAFAGGRKTSSTDRDLHAILGASTVGLYAATAYFAIRAPKIPGIKTRGPIRLHKTLAWIHGPGMVLTPILGEMAFAQKSNGERIHGIARLHGPVAIATGAAFGLAVASVSFKF